MALGVGAERRQIDDGELGHELGEVDALGTDQQLANEQRVPGVFGEDAGLDAVFRIGAAVQILREQFLAFAVRDGNRRADCRNSLSTSCGCRPTRPNSRSARRQRCACPWASGRCDGRSRRRARRWQRSSPHPPRWRARRAPARVRFQWTAASPLKPNLSAPYAPLRTPVSCTRIPPKHRPAACPKPLVDRDGPLRLENISIAPRIKARDHSHQAPECQD